jgi:hypothetical protein
MPVDGGPGMGIPAYGGAAPFDAGTDAPVATPAYGAPGMVIEAGSD